MKFNKKIMLAFVYLACSLATQARDEERAFAPQPTTRSAMPVLRIDDATIAPLQPNVSPVLHGDAASREPISIDTASSLPPSVVVHIPPDSDSSTTRDDNELRGYLREKTSTAIKESYDSLSCGVKWCRRASKSVGLLSYLAHGTVVILSVTTAYEKDPMLGYVGAVVGAVGMVLQGLSAYTNKQSNQDAIAADLILRTQGLPPQYNLHQITEAPINVEKK